MHVHLYSCMLLVGVQKKKREYSACMGKEQATMHYGWLGGRPRLQRLYVHARVHHEPAAVYTYAYQAIIL